MKKVNVIYLNAIAKQWPLTVEGILEDKRLNKHLWVEFILNPKIVAAFELYVDNPVVKGSLSSALSWYIGFRWLIPQNDPLERLCKKSNIKPYILRGELYRLGRRNFLKGILHARLC